MTFKEWIRTQPCCVCQYPGTTHEDGQRYNDPAHVQSRGAGGKDENNLVPLCRHHHDAQHRKGTATFQLRHQVCLYTMARQYYQKYQKEVDN